MTRFSLYVVDDEESIRHGVSYALKKEYLIKSYAGGKKALSALKEKPCDLILLDIGLPDMSGLNVLKKIKSLHPDIIVIMITGLEDIPTVVSAMKSGAHDYIVKPLHLDSLRIIVKNALETIRLKKEILALQEKFLKENLPCFIGGSDTIQDIMAFIDKIAKSVDTPVFIQGESGTGKELISHTIHFKSPCYRKPFVPVNCAAIPAGLVETELFGYEKGAFTGAKSSGKQGLVEEAAGGTLFLDEISELDQKAQAKLLRFLDTGEYYRVGGTKKRRVKLRIISATNKDLLRLVEDGLFREDLYYRLAVVKLKIPSLNDRRDDILTIAKYFLHELGQKFGKVFSGISPEAKNILKNHHWKGNVRELKNIIERGVLTGDGPILMRADLGMEKFMPTSDFSFPPLGESGIDLNQFEKHYIREALKKAGGNTTKAAELLGMSYYAFRYRLRKLKNKD